MDNRPLFLDTNVFIGYAVNGHIESFNSDCCIVFSAQNSRHTSHTVRQELRKKIRDRRKLYSEILQHISAKRPPDDFAPSSGNRTDRTHGIKDLQLFKKGLLDLEYIRTLHTQLEQGILDALATKTRKVLVDRSQDADMKDHFQFILGIHPPDNQVLADFTDWGMLTGGACFVTCDGGIDKKKDKIKRYIRDCKGDCDHLSLWFVTSAARRLAPSNT